MTDSSEPQKTYAEKNRTNKMNNPKLATDYKSILYIACAASMLKAEGAFGSIPFQHISGYGLLGTMFGNPFSHFK